MATKYRRIAVVEDPELKEALERAAGDVPHRSRASLLRELALIGARQTSGQREPTTLDRLLAIPGARGPRPGEDDIGEFFRNHPLIPSTEGDPYALSRLVDEEREDRI